MERSEAARLLGVAIDAERADVQSAFRRQVRLAHPDVNESPTIDLSILATARDTMMLPSGTSGTRQASSAGRPKSSPATPKQEVPAQATSSMRINSPAPKKSGGSSFVWGAILALGVLACIAFAGIAVWAIAGGDADSEFSTGECLIVSPSGADATSCDTPGAQRVVEQLDEPGACPEETGALLVGTTMWCLESVDPG